MKVFGIGLSRTGTTSLNKALNILGIKSIHGPHDPTTKAEYRAGQYSLTILKEYDAITDIPMSVFFPHMDQLFPGSKFILTVRDVGWWLNSMEQHYKAVPRGEWKEFIRAATYGCIEFNPDRYAYVYERHLEFVKQYFKDRNDLLIIDICGGPKWEPLCQFLSKPVPDQVFPHLNFRHPRIPL